jgi:hypothetical protein
VAIRKCCAPLCTPAILLDLLITGIDSWLNDTAFLCDCPVAQQERIGWGQLLLGRFGSHWCVLQDEHLHTFFYHKSNTLSGLSWILAITQTIWTHVALA